MDGIQRLLKAELAERPQALIQPYLDVVEGENQNGTLARYPGSPLIARKLFRPQDRLSALELHPEDARKLRKLFDGDVQARATELDGWLALGAYVPPKEKRGLVLVDPPFEEEGECERLVDGLVRGPQEMGHRPLCALVSAQGRARGQRLHRRPQGDAALPACCAPS